MASFGPIRELITTWPRAEQDERAVAVIQRIAVLTKKHHFAILRWDLRLPRKRGGMMLWPYGHQPNNRYVTPLVWFDKLTTSGVVIPFILSLSKEMSGTKHQTRMSLCFLNDHQAAKRYPKQDAWVMLANNQGTGFLCGVA